MFFLLTVYSLGVIINLLRGKSNISCGCGGSLESNHLSWPLIIRNLIFIIFFLFTYTFETKMGNVQFILMDQSLNHIYSYDLVITVLLAFSTWIVFFLIILKFNDKDYN
ncbi:hypothetical protein J5V76_28760 (plasmid) [Bacillus mycoides]|nr:hypothetical protein J5V76_28760 [Bacillus mycoides]